MSITIKEIARLANVSRATVDKVIHDRPGVKKETRERIVTILNELNYEPNLIGKALVRSGSPYKIAIILSSEYSTFIQYTLKGLRLAEKEFAPFGIEVVVKTLTSFEPAELVSILNELQEEKVAGIGLLPIDDEQVKNKLNQIAASGIPIVTFNSHLEDIDQLCYVEQNHYRGGWIAAGLMEKLLPENGEIGVIISTKSLSCHPKRLAGFCDRVAKSNKKLSILEIQENFDRKEDAFRLTLDYCHKYPEMQGIYISGGGVPGVANALLLEGREQNIALICHDLYPETEELLKKDIVDFILDQDSTAQAYQVVKVLFDKIVRKRNPKVAFFDIPLRIITKDFLQDFSNKATDELCLPNTEK